MARLIFVDTETTGPEPGKDAICQVCYREGNQVFLGELMRLRNCSEEAAIAEMKKISTSPLLLRKFNFGKYRGRSIGEIAARNRSYLQWLLSQKLGSGENDKNWIYTLRHYLGH
ncbi:MAG: hypothetical protein OHK0011_01210 [Turneriella sp.]